jgi:hypothetical protein
MDLLKKDPLIALAGHGLFGLLSALSIVFWQERTLILDAAFQSYLLICDSEPAIMVQRFGVLPIQLLPLAGVWLGLSLPKVLMLFSLSYVLFQWCLFAISLHGLRNNRAAIAIALFNILLSGDCFYWMQNELLPAVSLLFVLIALAEKQAPYSSRILFLFALLSITLFFLHPLMVFPLGYVLCFFGFDARASVSRSALLRIYLFFTLAFCLKYVLQPPNFYDRGMTGQFVREFELSMLFQLHKSEGFALFCQHLDDSMILFLPLWLLVNIVLTKQKKWLKVLIFNAFILVYAIVLFVRFREDKRWYIIESHLQAMSVFMLLPLLWDVVLSTHFRYLKAGLALLLCLRLWGIYQNHMPYTARLMYIKALVRQAQGRKTVLRPDQVNNAILMMQWGLPFETLHTSALASPDSAKVLVVVPTPGQDMALPPNDSMPTFLQLPRKAFRDLPVRYYRVGDSVPYQLVDW